MRILGWLDDGQPVMGVVESYAAKVFFIGDPHALIMDIAQPLVDNLIDWGF